MAWRASRWQHGWHASAMRPPASPHNCCASGCVGAGGVQVSIKEDSEEQETEILKTLNIPAGRIQRVAWTDLNATLISASEDGMVRRWDVEVPPPPPPPLPQAQAQHPSVSQQSRDRGRPGSSLNREDVVALGGVDKQASACPHTAALTAGMSTLHALVPLRSMARTEHFRVDGVVAGSQTGEVKDEKKVHDAQINDLKMSADGTHFITASADKTAKLIDSQAGRPAIIHLPIAPSCRCLDLL